MKQALLCVLIVIVSTVAAAAQTAPDAAELTKMLNEFLDGASKNDPAAHEKFWADDLIYTRSTGVRTTKAEIMKGLRTPQPAKADGPVPVYSAEDIQIHQYGAKNEFAIVAFRLVIKATDRVSSNLNTGVFLKRKGVWQVVAWQSTVAPEPKTETKPGGGTSAVASDKPSTKTESAHTYQKGGRGGCYYLNSSGGKVYVDHKYCSQ